MRRLVMPLFFVLLTASGLFVIGTSSTLPERVASHFARGGEANGWMPRETYVAFILIAALGVPFALVALLAWLPRAFTTAVNLPNRAYWFAAERREATFASFSSFAWIFGSMLAALMAGVHWAILRANARTPPRFPESAFLALLIGFGCVLAIWLAAWYLRFRRPGR